jgi:hypothetical protein
MRIDGKGFSQDGSVAKVTSAIVARKEKIVQSVTVFGRRGVDSVSTGEVAN